MQRKEILKNIEVISQEPEPLPAGILTQILYQFNTFYNKEDAEGYAQYKEGYKACYNSLNTKHKIALEKIVRKLSPIRQDTICDDICKIAENALYEY